MKPIKLTRSELRHPPGPRRRIPAPKIADGLTMVACPAALEDLGMTPPDGKSLVIHPDGREEWQ